MGMIIDRVLLLYSVTYTCSLLFYLLPIRPLQKLQFKYLQIMHVVQLIIFIPTMLKVEKSCLDLAECAILETWTHCNWIERTDYRISRVFVRIFNIHQLSKHILFVFMYFCHIFCNPRRLKHTNHMHKLELALMDW